MAKQAKCTPCNIRFTWKDERGLRNIQCPLCCNTLDRTTHLSNLTHLRIADNDTDMLTTKSVLAIDWHQEDYGILSYYH